VDEIISLKTPVKILKPTDLIEIQKSIDNHEFVENYILGRDKMLMNQL